MPMVHKVVQAYPAEEFRVYLYFDDGHIKLFDATALKEKGKFQKLKEGDFFKRTCTVLNGTLAWDLSGRFDPQNCLDLDPEELYRTCKEVEDPLGRG
jgi:hypothetical protein